MLKPPADADPEKFVLGGGDANVQTARVDDDGRTLRLVPAPRPTGAIVLMNLLFVAFTCGFYWLCHRVGAFERTPWARGFIVLIGVVMCVGYTWPVLYLFARARRLGPLLAYDRSTGRLTLPREGVAFERAQIIQLQYVTTKRLQVDSAIDNDRVSELNLITLRDGERKRWPLLKSIVNVRAFDRTLRPFATTTDLPIVRVTDEWLGWGITERPFREEVKTAV